MSDEMNKDQIATLIRNLEESSANEGSHDPYCRCVDSLRAINQLRAALSAQPVPPAQDAASEQQIDPLQRAARDLPEGFQIVIDLENGAGCITLLGPEGEYAPLENDHETFNEAIHAVIDQAIAARAAQEKANVA